MNIKHLLTLSIFLCSVGAMAQEQSQPADSIPYEFRKQAYIYSMAQRYNDPSVSRMALYNLIAENPGATGLMDSLALLYYDYQQYASAALVAQDVLRIDPNDEFALEIAGISFDNLGVKDRAVSNYEKLYLLTDDLGTLYRVAFLQFELKRYGESITNADIILESPKAEEVKLLFPLTNQRNQQIGIKAASLRLKGMIEADRGNTSLAKEFYQKALEMEPSFEVAKTELAEMN